MQLKTIGISVEEDVGATPYFDVDMSNAEEAENAKPEQVGKEHAKVESSSVAEDAPPTSRPKKEKSTPKPKRKKSMPKPKRKKVRQGRR